MLNKSCMGVGRGRPKERRLQVRSAFGMGCLERVTVVTSLPWIIKSLFVLLALGLWALACPASFPEDDDLKALDQQVNQLIEQGKYQEAIPIEESVVEVAKRVRGSEHPETAEALTNLGLIFQIIGDFAKAEPPLQEALRIRQKVFGPEHPYTTFSLDNLGSLYRKCCNYEIEGGRVRESYVVGFDSKHTNNKAMEQTDLRARRTATRLAFADHMNRLVTGDRSPSSPE